MAEDNMDWGYDRIVGVLANLGHEVSDQTVGNVLKRDGILPAPERRKTTTWAQFRKFHMAVLAGRDFLSVEVLTQRGLQTFSMCCSSFTWKAARWKSPASRCIRTSNGCSRSPGT